jgi:hypothetical protein
MDRNWIEHKIPAVEPVLIIAGTNSRILFRMKNTQAFSVMPTPLPEPIRPTGPPRSEQQANETKLEPPRTMGAVYAPLPDKGSGAETAGPIVYWDIKPGRNPVPRSGAGLEKTAGFVK